MRSSRTASTGLASSKVAITQGAEVRQEWPRERHSTLQGKRMKQLQVGWVESSVGELVMRDEVLKLNSAGKGNNNFPHFYRTIIKKMAMSKTRNFRILRSLLFYSFNF